MQPIKITELKSSDTAQHYDFLEDHMKEKAIELIQALPQTDIQDDLEIWYSLSNCQGDGVCIRGWRITLTRISEPKYINPQVLLLIEEIKKEFAITETKQLEVSITFSHRGNYNHENSFDIDLSWNCIDENENYINQDDSKYDHEAIFIDTYRNICKQLEKYWYSLIEDEDNEEICREALIRFSNINNFEDEIYIDEYEYTTEEKQITDDMIQVATKGDTQFDWLWVALPSFEVRTRDEHYRAFID